MTFKKRLIVLVGAGGASGTVKTVLDGGVMTATINLHGLSGTGYRRLRYTGARTHEKPARITEKRRTRCDERE